MRLTIICLVAIVTAGCQTVSVDVSYVKTNEGFLNSGLLTIGDLFLLDTSDNTLTKLARLNGKSVETFRESVPFSSKNAENIRGAVINGEVSQAVRATIELEISSRAYVKLVDGRRDEIKHTFDAISEQIESEIARGNDVATRWYLDEASQRGSPLRLALVVGAIKANKSVVGYDREIAANGSIRVPTGPRGSVNVKIVGSSIEKFEGNKVPVFLDVEVLEVFKNNKGNYDYRFDRKFGERIQLSAALRKL